MFKNLLFFISLVLAAAMLLTLVFGQKEPDDLGLKNGLLAPCPDKPICVSSQAENPDRRVEPLIVPYNVIDPIAKLKILLQGMEGIRVMEEEKGYLRARFLSNILWIKSDLEFFHDPLAKVVHVRSASRLGLWDFGTNRKMVERIRGLFSPESPHRPGS